MQIGEAFRRFGVSDATTDLIVVKVGTTPAVDLGTVQSHLSEAVKGQESPFTDGSLINGADVPRICKVYKLPSSSAGKTANGVHPSHDNQQRLEVQILGAMALRGAT